MSWRSGGLRICPCSVPIRGNALEFAARRSSMVFNNMSSPAAVRLQPVEPRHAPLLCFGLLVTSCALASFALACATPFAAFAAIAAATLPWRPACLVVVGAWLINQAIGFGVHHYPVDASTIAWGFVIGAAAL